MNSKPCNDLNENQIRATLKDKVKVTRDEFVYFPMWFDKDESCISLPGYEVFDRVVKLKELLFDINKEDDVKLFYKF